MKRVKSANLNIRQVVVGLGEKEVVVCRIRERISDKRKEQTYRTIEAGDDRSEQSIPDCGILPVHRHVGR